MPSSISRCAKLIKNLRIHRLVLLALLISVGLANAEMLVGQVVGVSDGDTITLISEDKSQHKIRLAGIDAPEKAQAFGQASKQSLSEMVFNKEVTVLWTKRDRYQRLVGKVLMNDMDVCLEQIKRGMAWHYKE
jgi:endonuclease YncB( thermonuclease family)